MTILSASAAWLAPFLAPVAAGRGLAVAITAALLVMAVTRLGSGARTGPPA
jgi:hypothetical protein